MFILLVWAMTVANVEGAPAGPVAIYEGLKTLREVWDAVSPFIMRKLHEPTLDLMRDMDSFQRRFINAEQFLNMTIQNLQTILEEEQRVCAQERTFHIYGNISWAAVVALAIVITRAVMLCKEKRHTANADVEAQRRRQEATEDVIQRQVAYTCEMATMGPNTGYGAHYVTATDTVQLGPDCMMDQPVPVHQS